MNMIKDFLHEEDGATAIEYALIVGLIAVVIIVALTVLGESIETLFKKITAELERVAPKTDG